MNGRRSKQKHAERFQRDLEAGAEWIRQIKRRFNVGDYARVNMPGFRTDGALVTVREIRFHSPKDASSGVRCIRVKFEDRAADDAWFYPHELAAFDFITPEPDFHVRPRRWWRSHV